MSHPNGSPPKGDRLQTQDSRQDISLGRPVSATTEEQNNKSSNSHRQSVSVADFITPRATKPSDLEEKYYYYGFPSRPRLVARTSTDIWDVASPEYHHLSSKRILTIQDDRIFKMWKAGTPFSEEIFDVLEGFPWVGIEFLRIKTTMPSLLPAEPITKVMFITVDNNSTDWECAYRHALACKECLQKAGIFDVEVEVKQSALSFTSTSDRSGTDEIHGPGGPGDTKSDPPCLYDGTPDIFQESANSIPIDYHLVGPLRHLSDTIGTRLFPEPYTGKSGTKGLYLRISPIDSESWSFDPCIAALTCRHVVFLNRLDDGDMYRCSDQPEECRFIGQNTGYDDISRKAQRTLDDDKQVHQCLQAFDWRSGQKDPDEKARLDIAYKAMGKMAFLARRVKRFMKDTRQDHNMAITIGNTLFAPSFSVIHPPNKEPWLRDYALIKISMSVHTRQPLNRLPLSRETFLHNALPLHDKWVDIMDTSIIPADGGNAMLRPDIIPEAEIEDLVKRETVLGKYGAHGLTYGKLNDVKSVIRHPRINGLIRDLKCWEVCIVSHPRAPPCQHRIFSQPSDSGSAVWDMTGRVLGMVTGGVGSSQPDGEEDITYVTPMEKILNDLREHGMDASLV